MRPRQFPVPTNGPDSMPDPTAPPKELKPKLAGRKIPSRDDSGAEMFGFGAGPGVALPRGSKLGPAVHSPSPSVTREPTRLPAGVSIPAPGPQPQQTAPTLPAPVLKAIPPRKKKKR